MEKTKRPIVDCDVPASLGEMDRAEQWAIRRGLDRVKISDYLTAYPRPAYIKVGGRVLLNLSR